MAENLKTYFEEQLSRYQTMCDESTLELAQTNDDLSDLVSVHATQVTAYSELQRSISAKRTAMSAANLMPADLETLTTELRQMLIDQRVKRTELLSTEDQISVLENARDRLVTRKQLIDTSLTESASELALVSEQAETHAEWAQKVTDNVIVDLQASVTEILDIIDGGSLPVDAEANLLTASQATIRINTDIPEILRNHALSRGDYLDTQLEERQNQLDALQQTIVDQQASDFGVSGALAQAQLAYGLAEEAYAEVVAKGETYFAQAISMLQSITASNELTDAEKDRIAAIALPVDADALLKEQARDVAQAAVKSKVLEIEAAINAALVADIDADPEVDSEVIARRTELSALQTTLSTAQTEFDSSMQEALALWQAAVPDAIWNNLINYNEAVDMLRALKAADVAALGLTMSNAETVLVDALLSEEQAQRLLDELEYRALLLTGRESALADSRHAHLISAVRGDEGYHSSLVQGEIL